MKFWSNLYQRQTARLSEADRKETFGIDGSWFFTVVAEQYSKQAKRPVEKDVPAAVDSEVDVRHLIAENPEINASTLLNLIKSKGYKIVKGSADGESTDKTQETVPKGVDPEKYDRCVAKVKKQGTADNPHAVCAATLGKEADTASANAQTLRAYESKRFSVGWQHDKTSFKEATGAKDNGIGWSRFSCVLLQEGLGNFNDAFYYTKEAIKSAVPVFEGKKIYADHQDSIEEQTRPERSVRDILGHFENVQYQETDAGIGQLVGDVIILGDKDFEWARGLLRHSVEYKKKHPDQDFVGLSISAGGVAAPVKIGEFLEKFEIPAPCRLKIEEAIKQGVEEIRVVSALDEAKSCDLVTEAGAGGRVVNFKEGMGETMAKKKDKVQAREAEAGKGLQEALAEKVKEWGMEGMEGQAAEAYEACKGMGMSDEEAMKQTETSMKMAKAIADKKSKEAEAEADPEDGCDDKSKDQEMLDKEAAQESAGNKTLEQRVAKLEESNMQLVAENTALKTKENKKELDQYVDSKLRESKLPNSATKTFREAAGEIKSKEDFDSKFKIFSEAYKKNLEDSELDFTMTDKESSFGASGEADKAAFDFSECAN